MENNKDFEEMRQQMDILKNKIDNQKITNDSIINNAITKKIDKLNKLGWGLVIFGLLEIPLVMWVFRSLCGFSWLFCIVTALYVLATVVFQAKLNQSVQTQIRPDDNLMAVSRQLVKLKRRNLQQLFASMPLSALWAAYFLWETYQVQHIGPLDFQTILYIVIFGVALGLVVGLSAFIKRYKATNDAFSQLEVFLPQTNQLWQRRVNEAIDTIQESEK